MGKLKYNLPIPSAGVKMNQEINYIPKNKGITRLVSHVTHAISGKGYLNEHPELKGLEKIASETGTFRVENGGAVANIRYDALTAAGLAAWERMPYQDPENAQALEKVLQNVISEQLKESASEAGYKHDLTDPQEFYRYIKNGRGSIVRTVVGNIIFGKDALEIRCTDYKLAPSLAKGLMMLKYGNNAAEKKQ